MKPKPEYIEGPEAWARFHAAMGKVLAVPHAEIQRRIAEHRKEAARNPHKRGPKSKRNPQDEEMQKLRRENQRLTEELRKAAIVIDVQKKVGAVLGWPLPKADPEEKP